VVRIDLDNGSWIELDPFGAYWTPNKLNLEISAQIGAKPKFKKSDEVQELVRLIFWLCEHYEAIQVADRAWGFGAEDLRRATICDVDMDDQASRWRAFERLDAATRHDVVLLDSKTGNRYVRTQWLVSHLRANSDPGEAGPMKAALERHGWKKSGKQGRIK